MVCSADAPRGPIRASQADRDLKISHLGQLDLHGSHLAARGFCHGAHFVRLCRWHHTQEFLTPDAAENFGLGEALPEGIRHGLQDCVAGGVAELVIDRFEVVDIDHQDACGLVTAGKSGQAFGATAPVLQASQRVHDGKGQPGIQGCPQAISLPLASQDGGHSGGKFLGVYGAKDDAANAKVIGGCHVIGRLHQQKHGRLAAVGARAQITEEAKACVLTSRSLIDDVKLKGRARIRATEDCLGVEELNAAAAAGPETGLNAQCLCPLRADPAYRAGSFVVPIDLGGLTIDGWRKARRQIPPVRGIAQKAADAGQQGLIPRRPIEHIIGPRQQVVRTIGAGGPIREHKDGDVRETGPRPDGRA